MSRPFTRRRIGRFLSGRLDVARLLRLSEDDRADLLAEARRLFSAHQIDDARRIFLLVTTLWPEGHDGPLGVGACLQVEGQIEPAIERYDQALRLRPDDPFAATNRAECLVSLGRIEEAGKALVGIEATGEVLDRIETLREHVVSQADEHGDYPGGES